MSADLLREAAALMRSRAKSVEAAAVPTPWRAIPDLDHENYGWHVVNGIVDADYDNTVAHCLYDTDGSGGTAQHIASWHPDVTVDVSSLLDNIAFYYDSTPGQIVKWANSLASAYLGRES